MHALDRMKKVHIWIGTTLLSEDDYYKYFDQDNGTCPFCLDIGVEEYDEDFMVIIPLFEKEIDIKEILTEVVIDDNEIESVINECKNKNISKANAVFYITDASVVINEPYLNNYNGLKYIGLYNTGN